MKTWLEHLEEEKGPEIALAEPQISLVADSQELSGDYRAYVVYLRLLVQGNFSYRAESDEYTTAKRVSIERIHRKLFGEMIDELHEVREAVSMGDRSRALRLIHGAMDKMTGRDIS